MTSTELSLRLQTSTGKDFTEALAIVVQRRDQSAVPILIGILGRGDVKIVSALAKLGDQRAVAPISNLLNSYGLYSSESHSYLARAAIAALKELGDQKAVPALERLLGAFDYRVACSAADALGSLRLQSSLPSLLNALHHHHPYVRGAAARALGSLGLKATVRPITYLFEATDIWLSGAHTGAAEALGALGCPSAIEPLRSMLWKSRPIDPSLTIAVAQSLLKLGANPIEELCYELRTSRETNVRWMAACAIGTFSELPSIDPLLRAMSDPEICVASSSIGSLGKLGRQEAVAPLIRQFDRSESCRPYIHRALLDIGGVVAETFVVRSSQHLLADRESGAGAVYSLCRLRRESRNAQRRQRAERLLRNCLTTSAFRRDWRRTIEQELATA